MYTLDLTSNFFYYYYHYYAHKQESKASSTGSVIGKEGGEFLVAALLEYDMTVCVCGSGLVHVNESSHGYKRWRRWVVMVVVVMMMMM